MVEYGVLGGYLHEQALGVELERRLHVRHPHDEVLREPDRQQRGASQVFAAYRGYRRGCVYGPRDWKPLEKCYPNFLFS